MTIKDLDYYKALPYAVTVRREEGDFVARVDELDGCVAHADTAAEALTRVEEAKEDWLAEALAAGVPVPEPSEMALPSGKWLQRVPRSLHRKLTATAAREKVSLNQLVTSILSEAVGRRQAMEVTPEPRLRSFWTHCFGADVRGPNSMVTWAPEKSSSEPRGYYSNVVDRIANSLPKNGVLSWDLTKLSESSICLYGKTQKEDHEKRCPRT